MEKRRPYLLPPLRTQEHESRPQQRRQDYVVGAWEVFAENRTRTHPRKTAADFQGGARLQLLENLVKGDFECVPSDHAE